MGTASPCPLCRGGPEAGAGASWPQTLEQPSRSPGLPRLSEGQDWDSPRCRVPAAVRGKQACVGRQGEGVQGPWVTPQGRSCPRGDEEPRESALRLGCPVPAKCRGRAGPRASWTKWLLPAGLVRMAAPGARAPVPCPRRTPGAQGLREDPPPLREARRSDWPEAWRETHRASVGARTPPRPRFCP